MEQLNQRSNNVFQEGIERIKHKTKRMIPNPDSYFMDVKCNKCFSISVIFSHSQTRVKCDNCGLLLCIPTGGKAKLSKGVFFIKKQ
jgi:small subunit ribosomal protein S27e